MDMLKKKSENVIPKKCQLDDAEIQKKRRLGDVNDGNSSKVVKFAKPRTMFCKYPPPKIRTGVRVVRDYPPGCGMVENSVGIKAEKKGLKKNIENVISRKRSLDDSYDHEHEAFKKSETLVSDTSVDLSYFVDNKDKRLKPPESRRINSSLSRETGKVKYLELTRSKHGQVIVPKVKISKVSTRKTSNITNAHDCRIRKMSFDGTNKLVGSQLNENNKCKNIKLPVIRKYPNSSTNGDAQISKGTSSVVSQKEVVRSQEIEKAKILFDSTYKEASYRNKLEVNGRKNQHLKILQKVKEIVKQKLNLMDAMKVCGTVPGVKIGNTFKYRQLLDLFGVHCQPVSGIDYTKINGKILAISIVDSHRYLNESQRSDMLVYCGEGGIDVFGPKSPPKDQKLERGNLALKNCIDEESPVRVIRKIKGDGNIKMYVYDGLYTVKKCVQTRSEEGKTRFKFHLHRIPGQPQLQTSFNSSR